MLKIMRNIIKKNRKLKIDKIRTKMKFLRETKAKFKIIRTVDIITHNQPKIVDVNVMNKLWKLKVRKMLLIK